MNPRNLPAYLLDKPYVIPLLLLVLALAYKSPALPPWGVPTSNDQLLIFPPWKAVYPETFTRLPGGDPLLQQLPWHHWAQDEFAHARFPLWASDPVGGAPLFASYQSAVLYPLNLLWMLVPIQVGAGIIEALKLWLAGLGMWYFLSAMGLRRSASFLGAVGLMFYSIMTSWVPWASSNVLLLLPWLAWSVYAWCIQEKKGALVAFSLLVLFAVLGGHTENLSIVLLTTALWAIALIVSSEPRRWPRPIIGLTLAGALGLVMGAIQLLPFIEALGLSHIAADSGRDNSWQLNLNIRMAVDWILPRWWGQVADGVLGGTNFTESNSYVGLPALLGVIFAFIAGFRKQLNIRLALPWLAIGILAWLIVYDDNLGLLIRRLPPLDRSIDLRWLFIIGFALLTLGAFGWDWFARRASEIRNQESQTRTRIAGALGLVLLTTGILILIEHFAGLFRQPELVSNGIWASPNSSYRWYWGIWAAGVALAVLGAALLWSVRWLGARTAPVMSLLLGAILVADLWMLTFTYYPASTPDKYYPTTGFISQVRSLVPPTERIIMEGSIMPANTGLVYNIRDWRYQDPMISERALNASRLLAPGYDKDIGMAYNMFLPSVKMEVVPAFGIRYVIYPAATNPATWEPFPNRPDFKRLAFKDGLGLWEIQDVPGFAYLSDKVDAVPGEPEAALWVQNMTWEKIRSYPAVVEAPPTSIASITRDPAGSSPGGASVTTYTPGHIIIEASAQRPALLVVAESYYPGWHATLDNQPADILRTNYISQGIVVPQGTHTIELKYEPNSFRNGVLLSLAGLLGLSGLFIWSRRKPRPRPVQADPA